MIYSLKPKKDKLVEGMYKKAMKELNKFYGLNWKHHLPQIIILKNRDEINKFWGDDTEDWLIAFAERRAIFMLDKKKYKKESSHKYSKESYYKTLKHELGHLFFGAISHENDNPAWLNEGTQYFVANQIESQKPPKRFSNFIDHYDKWSKSVYGESGFAVKVLVDKFGKEKLIRLIKSLRNISSEKKFKISFKKIYKFDLNYKEMNKLLK